MYHVLARHADFLSEGSFQGQLFDAGEYPGALPSSQPSHIVRGEVYTLRNPQLVLRILDEYEDVDSGNGAVSEFRRDEASIRLDNGSNVRAWIYLYNRPAQGLSVIPSGDYLAFRGSK
jgi:gamma-glutamylcyclotransferase (GGCT)/AIG2-like uncharacterized protein YtfP